MYDVYLSSKGRSVDIINTANRLDISGEQKIGLVTGMLNSVITEAYKAGRNGSSLIVDDAVTRNTRRIV